MVGLVRVELTTSPLSGVRSSHLSYRPRLQGRVGPGLGPERLQHGGADRNRTDGLLSANQALSQLSYSPDTASFQSRLSKMIRGRLDAAGRRQAGRRPKTPNSEKRERELTEVVECNDYPVLT